MLEAHCIGLVVQTCLSLDFLASVIMAFKQALATEQTTSTTSERTGQLFTCNRLTSITLKPQCMAVTLHMTWASLMGAASSNIICPSWIHDQCVAPSVCCSFCTQVQYTRAALANTVLEIVLGISLVSWLLSPSAPYLASLFPQQVQAILNSLLWLCHSHLEGGGVLLSY